MIQNKKIMPECQMDLAALKGGCGRLVVRSVTVILRH